MAWRWTNDVTIDRSNNPAVDYEDEVNNEMRRLSWDNGAIRSRTTIRPRRRCRRCPRRAAAGEEDGATTTRTTQANPDASRRLHESSIGDDDGEGRPTMMKYSTMTTTTFGGRCVGLL